MALNATPLDNRNGRKNNGQMFVSDGMGMTYERIHTFDDKYIVVNTMGDIECFGYIVMGSNGTQTSQYITNNTGNGEFLFPYNDKDESFIIIVYKESVTNKTTNTGGYRVGRDNPNEKLCLVNRLTENIEYMYIPPESHGLDSFIDTEQREIEVTTDNILLNNKNESVQNALDKLIMERDNI